MKSTGEVMGVSPRFGHAFAKACEGAGVVPPVEGTVFLTVNPFDKPAIEPDRAGARRLASASTRRRGRARIFRGGNLGHERIF